MSGLLLPLLPMLRLPMLRGAERHATHQPCSLAYKAPTSSARDDVAREVGAGIKHREPLGDDVVQGEPS